ncbi:MAG: hypothetical protein Q4C64_08365 [Erysipelotrichia bacterium]|nr:hypothetical protein [Erysipelotrichia bacterium]
MFKGIYEGKNAKCQNKRVLILGESHYDKDGYDNFTTKSVIENYHLNPNQKKYNFFHKIAQCFSVNTNDIDKEFEYFWNNMYFANYVDKLCGIGDSKAKNLIKGNRKEYNNELFDFINKNEIDIVFVFGRTVYNSLPSYSENKTAIEKQPNLDNDNIFVGNRKDFIAHCVYLKDESHENADIKLNKDIHIYGIRHPSAQCGFKLENYKPYLKKLI